MAIPKQFSVTLPLLEFLEDGQVHASKESVEAMAQHFNLTEEEKNEMLPSRKAKKFDIVVSWSRTILKSAGLLTSPESGKIQITDLGREVLSQKPPELNRASLMKFDGYRKLIGVEKEDKSTTKPQEPFEDASETTPQESIAKAHREIQEGLVAEILDIVERRSPQFFERLVVDLLVEMGYGGSREEAGQVIGGAGDAGIDGIIKEDRLGLDVIYIQAKRWEGAVGRGEIQKFAGALQGQRARKGVFITTSSFSRKAWEYTEKLDTKIILVDGSQLAEFMIEFGIGIETEASYEIKRINPSYFDE